MQNKQSTEEYKPRDLNDNKHENEIHVLSLDYDGCADILFWKEHSNKWFWTFAQGMFPDDLENEVEDIKEAAEGNWTTIEKKLNKHQRFQDFKRSICERLAQDFINRLKQITQDRKTIILIGSSRQYIYDEYVNTCNNGNGSCFENFQRLAEQSKQFGCDWTFLPWTYGDIANHQEVGTSVNAFHRKKHDFKEMERHWAQLATLTGPSEIPDYQYKYLFLSKQLEYVRRKYPEKMIYFDFIDDRENLVEPVYQSFSGQQEKIPGGITFNSIRIRYATGELVYEPQQAIIKPHEGADAEKPLAEAPIEKIPAGNHYSFFSMLTGNRPLASLLPNAHEYYQWISYANKKFADNLRIAGLLSFISIKYAGIAYGSTYAYDYFDGSHHLKDLTNILLTTLNYL